MSGWQKSIAQVLNRIELKYDALKYRLHIRLHPNQKLVIVPYRTYGTMDKLYVKGRVLEEKKITSAEENDSVWENLSNMYKRFQSDEIPYAKVALQFQQAKLVLSADEEGFFEGWIDPPDPLVTDRVWWEVDLELVEPRRNPPVRAQANVFVPPPQAQFGVISDIDDTVLQTGAANMIRMARTVFLGNARTRLPFKGAAAFYRALSDGMPANRLNPLFYVSSSPWNLYDLLSDFFHLQNIPNGPLLFLRDWGLTKEEFLPIENHEHKMTVSRMIMDMYNNLPFILVGDSSQQDPEIYTELVSLYPKRILAVYIRNVSKNLERPKDIQKLAQKVLEAGSTLILADDTLPMAKHAIDQGWINPLAFPEIHADKKADEPEPGAVEKILGVEPQKPAPTVTVKGDQDKNQVTIEPNPGENEVSTKKP